MSHIVILGAGAWGTALAQTALAAGNGVTLWGRKMPPISDTVAKTAVRTSDIGVVTVADIVLLVTPAQTTRAMLQQLDDLPAQTPLVICSKGLEQETGLRLDEVVHQWRPAQPVAYLSGPNFAAEVLAGVPTAGVVASADLLGAAAVCQQLSSPTFRLYASDDMIGVGLLGALKNPLAIGAGLIAGAAAKFNLGENTRAAFITRGLAELTRLGTELGAKAATFAGLAGIGDILLTCGSTQSRNYRYGLAIGSGQQPDTSHTVEGLPTIAAAHALAAKHKIEMPLIDALYDLLYRQQPLDAVIARLLSRPLKNEA